MAGTIAAIATPLAVGGISVIRISGDEAFAIADRVFSAASGGKLADKKGYTASFGTVCFEGRVLDQSVALVFRAPKSYTGEDVVELSCHGGIFITREILRAILESGASPAEPGEFTKRAFLNGKLSLTQAEAVADLIQANHGQALNAARTQMDGALAKKLQGIQEKLLALAGHLSAWVDYPEEDLPEVETDHLEQSLREALAELTQLLSTFDTGRMLRDGINTVIVGKPNVGKSTLMNLLAGCKKSIVTEYAGTTRDAVEETVVLNDVVLRLSDTAGIRSTEDPVERMGVEIARERISTAELVLAVFDSSNGLDEEDQKLIAQLEGKSVVAVVNKTDLESQLDRDVIQNRFEQTVYLSALEGESLTELAEAIKQRVGMLHLDAGSAILATERQRICAVHAKEALEEAVAAVASGMTLDAVTVTIETAIDDLMELSGGRVTEEVVNNVFSHFCVGK